MDGHVHGGWRSKVPHVFALVLGVVAAISALAAFGGAVGSSTQPIRRLLDDVLIPVPANLAYAAFMAVLAGATARRKRVAWWTLIVYFVLDAVASVLALGLIAFLPDAKLVDDAGKPLFSGWGRVATAISVGIAVAALIVLLLARREFYARVRKGAFWRALLVFAGVAAVGIGLGYSLVAAFPGTLQGFQEQLTYAAEKVLGGAFAFDVTRDGEASGAVNLILGLFGAIAVFAGLFTLLRSQEVASVLGPEEETQVRGLLDRYGERDSLGYFATRRDKAAIFAPSGKAAVTYRAVNGVSLASGDPIGDPEAWDKAIGAWLSQARGYGWSAAAMGASEEGATAYHRAGLKVMELGDEAILYADQFALDGREMRGVRQAVNRVERSGYTAQVRRHADIPLDEMRELANLATSWRDTDSERGFSMALGRLGDPNDSRCVLVEALDGDGRVVSLLSFSPWGRRGLSLDLMRRDKHAENGAMEFMVASLMGACNRLGVDRVSLNFAAFRSVFEEGARIGAGPVLRAWRRLLLFFSRWWQLESLYRSNAKYNPTWVPRFLCFGERRELAKVGLASMIAEGFVTVPGTPVAALDATGVAPLAGLPVAAQEAASGHEAGDEVSEQMGVRLAKLERLRAEGVDPYPVGFKPTASCAEVAARHPGLPPDTHTGDLVSVAGRLMLLRDHGRVAFATVRDWSGDLQLMLDKGIEDWTAAVDIGDQIGATGEVLTTRRGELSVHVDSWLITGKCLRPLPDKHSGLTDPEARVRQRYLDLITNSGARDLLRARSAAVHSLRESFTARGFIEVETPILQRIHGGANARPFTTHINAYDLRLYLRIAPELYLKRLAVGGVEKVFELGRTFRNEGVDYKHNPEFSMLEAYQAYADYDSMLALTREVVQSAATAANGECVIMHDGQAHDVSGDWAVRTVDEAISAALGEEVTADTDVVILRKMCDAAKIPYDPKWGRGAVVLEMYEHLVEGKTVLPTFYKDFPTDVSPLTRQHRRDPRLAERWDLVAFGTELGTAYSELTDPVEQRRRLTEQSLLAAGGDPEAMELDEDFLQALEFAMPPTGGLGIGVDRLVMLLTGRSIRETLPFPLVRASH
ncbi:bifunctional lysylphosphatidylglycerol synthetase/lysine--tRNA ligase LysX [Catellatospora sp. KI3]|uniref:bifunctional lysylphosphatidylglycerol synthetase/lysine--tRNA ligase LysX n=1 Tax=Catellatospora sp. KI3 TaxID=3041620 RepID=UPI002482F936|nr:bifunctional lysylphosphatidylglycerol synthetase/lysine--tRNA ligase LysX [Catellatospora sp. KI3]MDI1462408.1 bifunctional lysylphosphatidylglycerol synthetase/lysine--tRNA ligase LysX [Catellatospora sp. KI3]